MRKLLGPLLLLLLAFAATGFGPVALIEGDEARTPLFEYQLELVQQTNRAPDYNAQAVSILDGGTGKLMYGRNAHRRMAPASLTKIVTAIVALEKGRLGDVVKVKVNGYAMPGSSIMGIVPGEELTLEDLLYGLMLPSGNDAALAIAQYIGGTEERFVEMMNEKVAELGLKNTHFVNPHGLDGDDHYSSPYDIAMLGRYGMRNPAFARMVGTVTYVTKGKTPHQLLNGNRLLGQYAGANGVKTGFTENSGQSFVASVNRDGRAVFVGLIKSNDRLRDAKLLFEYFYENFRCLPLTLSANPFYKLQDDAGLWRDLAVDSNQYECVARWEVPYVRNFVWLDSQPAQGDAGKVGTGSFYYGDRTLAEMPAYVR
ncbi:MAG: D-alanyl-D-alanine carboxypeptidase [Chloroflexi bacterium]|nr:D-alanyl-D-alanine carboxypeptidase [Chloroflexota bacterium]